MRNYDIQRKLLTETFTPQDALTLALVDEKGIAKHLKMPNATKTQQHTQISKGMQMPKENQFYT